MSHWKLPLSLAAAAALAGTAGTAFAANHANTELFLTGRIQAMNLVRGTIRIDGRTLTVAPNSIKSLSKVDGHSQVDLKLNRNDDVIGVIRASEQAARQTGPITAISSSSITIGSNTYTLLPNAPIRYHEYTLTPSQVPLNTEATVKLDNAGNVVTVRLHSDSNLPNHPVLKGQITALTANSMTTDGYTLPVSSHVVVRKDDRTIAYSAVAANQNAIVQLNRAGAVNFIVLQNQKMVRGTISADTSSSLTIGTHTYTYAPNAQIRYHDYTLNRSEVPTGSEAIVKLNAMGQAQQVILETDVNLPSQEEVSGTISAVGTSSIAVTRATSSTSYQLPLASTFDVSYQGTNSLTNTVTTGETANVHLNKSGQVDRLIIGVSGSVSKH